MIVNQFLVPVSELFAALIMRFSCNSLFAWGLYLLFIYFYQINKSAFIIKHSLHEVSATRSGHFYSEP
jgi:hypothetical protein